MPQINDDNTHFYTIGVESIKTIYETHVLVIRQIASAADISSERAPTFQQEKAIRKMSAVFAHS